MKKSLKSSLYWHEVYGFLFFCFYIFFHNKEKFYVIMVFPTSTSPDLPLSGRPEECLAQSLREQVLPQALICNPLPLKSLITFGTLYPSSHCRWPCLSHPQQNRSIGVPWGVSWLCCLSTRKENTQGNGEGAMGLLLGSGSLMASTHLWMSLLWTTVTPLYVGALSPSQTKLFD